MEQARGSLQTTQDRVREILSGAGRGTPLHFRNPLFTQRSVPPPSGSRPAPRSNRQAAPAMTQADLHLSRESCIGDSRRELYEGRMAAWDREADTLVASIARVKAKPSVAGIKLARGRKEELERKALTAHSLFEDVLSCSKDDNQLLNGRELGGRQRESVERKLQGIEEAISACEEQVLEQGVEEQGARGGSVVVEKLAMPKFSGNALDYVEYKDLFTELVSTLRVSEAAKMEYLRKSLDAKLLYIVRGAKDRKEAWRCLDEHFADRAGSIRTILRNLVAIDLSKGKLYERVDKLKNEIEHAQYLLKGLKAEGRLAGDIELVGRLLEKLPARLREKWVDWSTAQGQDLVPGEDEWPSFLEWLAQVRRAAMKDRWYDEQEAHKSSSSSVARPAPLKGCTMDYLNAQV